MRTRPAFLLLALSLSVTTLGCRPWRQYNCDTLGVCTFGTQPSYGRFAPPGPHPQPQYGTPIQGTPTYGDPTFSGPYLQPNGATLGQPIELQQPPTVESF